jgi:hypothetical protein
MLPGSVTLRPAPCAMTRKVHRTVLAPAEARSVIARRNRTELVLSRRTICCSRLRCYCGDGLSAALRLSSTSFRGWSLGLPRRAPVVRARRCSPSSNAVFLRRVRRCPRGGSRFAVRGLSHGRRTQRLGASRQGAQVIRNESSRPHCPLSPPGWSSGAQSSSREPRSERRSATRPQGGKEPNGDALKGHAKSADANVQRGGALVGLHG